MFGLGRIRAVPTELDDRLAYKTNALIHEQYNLTEGAFLERIRERVSTALK